MSLYSISGIGCEDCVSGCGYIGGRKKAARRQKRATRKAKRKARKSGVNCKGARVKAVVLAPARNAFLGLIRLNVKKIAVKLYENNYRDPAKKLKLHQKWCKLGGNASKLEAAITKAYNKYKRKRGIVGYMDMQDGQIGSVAGLIAAAKPILAALKPFLKTAIKKAAPLVKKAISKYRKRREEADEGVNEAEEYTQEYQQEDENAEVGAVGINPLLIGAAGLGIYLLTRKSK